jgi:hypothetical protein
LQDRSITTIKIVILQAILSGQLLFFTQCAPELAPAFCLRHDVDGLIWQPMGDGLEQPWKCLHTAALQALGYIQASKEQRKFTVAPPSKYPRQDTQIIP